jgi:hypothetical protein
MRKLMIGKQERGIALLVALGTMIVVLIVGSLALYVVVRGMNVTRGQTRYETTYEAAVAALEISKAKAESLNVNLSAPSPMTDTVRIGGYDAAVVAERTSAQVITMSGTAIKFARAISGPGATPASGSYRTYYVSATILGRSGERVGVEALQRFTTQAQ